MIRERLPRVELLLQLAEECTELAHAAMKLVRAMDGTNPTPVTVQEAETLMIDEAADVLLCLDTVIDARRDLPVIEAVMTAKLQRWRERLEAAQGGNADVCEIES